MELSPVRILQVFAEFFSGQNIGYELRAAVDNTLARLQWYIGEVCSPDCPILTKYSVTRLINVIYREQSYSTNASTLRSQIFLFSLLRRGSSLLSPGLLLNFTFKFHLRGSNGKTLSYSLGMQIFHKQPIENNTQLKVWGHSLNLNNVEIFIYNNNVVVMRLFNFHVADIEYCEYYWNF